MKFPGRSTRGPYSLRHAYERDVGQRLGRRHAEVPVTDADLAALPGPIQRYLHVAGAVGQPHVRSMRARMRGRIRGAPDAAWMPLKAEQHNFFDQPSRFFYLTASRLFVPFQAYHRYAGHDATMTVRVAGVIPVVQASGDVMTRSETVTLFNDMCLMAPATLLDAPVAWDPIDEWHVRAAFTNAGYTIHATLVFNGAGELADFRSEDRAQFAAGKSPVRAGWSTPVGSYRAFGRMHLMGGGQALWHDARGDWAYIELEMDEIGYNLGAGGPGARPPISPRRTP